MEGSLDRGEKIRNLSKELVHQLENVNLQQY